MISKEYKQRQIIASLLAMLFFLGNIVWLATGYCQPATEAGGYPPVVLDSSWKIKQADSPEFSSPLYNDDDWQTIRVPANTQEWFPDQSGYLWYRQWVQLPPGKPLYDLGIRLGRIASADEVYVNGYQIGSSGSGRTDELDNEKIRIYPIPAAVLAADGYNLVAIRVNRYYSDFGGLYNEPVIIDEYSQLINQLIHDQSVKLVFSSVFLLLGTAVLFFFAIRRQQKELLFFSLGVISLGVYIFYGSQWRYYLGMETIYDTRLYYISLITIAPAFARFAYVYLEGQQKEDKAVVDTVFGYYTRGMLLYAVVIDGLLLLYDNGTFWYYFMTFVSQYLGMPLCTIAGLYSLYQFTIVSWDKKLLVFMFGVAFASGTAETVEYESYIPGNLVMWGVMALVLISTMVMANRFFRLQDKVKEYSAGLEKLVDIRTRQLKVMEESRRRLLANISHDLRTPVSSVLGHAELLMEDVVESPEQQRAYIKRIHDKMLGFNRLIQDLFELAKIESQQERFRMAPVTAASLVENIYQKYLYDVQNAGTIFENNSRIPPVVRLMADEDRLDQVFANLISNSLRYISPGGRIAIGCRLTDKPPDDLAVIGSGKFIRFTVADDGIGIEPEQALRIFERFCRGNEAARDNPSEHSGLGLAIAKEIILAHGGRIWVDTTVSRGCTIHFVLPAIE
ncbi:Alkaline phosphatase synthesis sensor protein PhoR [Sporomusa ovata DSM 2662]|uniref:histidine kinase n=1 Tax=Sporomusa ovata TaxID=2378 RepID=A0A0U1L298_9FIRM|nr:ATP-binding protein [Sporomusa ovata]EQB24522.1 sensor histidine kinase ResE [Sporomusa ovata DSM 2662]CQR73459.1 Phosphate regulon sensor protein PhoR (SphS) [Sporomusa ovata]